MENQKRYELKKNEFGYYFYDSIMNHKMNLKLVESHLNYSHIDNITKTKIINIKQKELYKLRKELDKYK